jgi:hypothetical protein
MKEKEFSKIVSPNPKSHITAGKLESQRGFSGILPYTGEWTTTGALHLARRTLFGSHS